MLSGGLLFAVGQARADQPCAGDPPADFYEKSGQNLDAVWDHYLVTDLVCWEMMKDQIAGKAINQAIKLGKVEEVGSQKNGRHLKITIGDKSKIENKYDLQQDHDDFMAMLFKNRTDKLYQPIWGNVYDRGNIEFPEANKKPKNIFDYYDSIISDWKDPRHSISDTESLFFSATYPDLFNDRYKRTPPYIATQQINSTALAKRSAYEGQLIAFSLSQSLDGLKQKNPAFYEKLQKAPIKYELKDCLIGLYAEGHIIKSVYSAALDQGTEDKPADYACYNAAFQLYAGLINVSAYKVKLLLQKRNVPESILISSHLLGYIADTRFFRYLMLTQPKPGSTYDEISTQFMKNWPRYMAGERNFSGDK